MTFTLLELVNAEEAIKKLSMQQLSPKIAYRIAKLIKSIQSETSIFYEQRNSIIKSMSNSRDATNEEKSKGMIGPVFEVKSELIEEYKNKMKDLVDITVNINCEPLPLDMLEEIKISSLDMIALGNLVKE